MYYDNFADMYNQMLSEVFEDPHYETAPRGQKIKERINTTHVLTNPTSNMFTNEIRSIPKRYIAGELEWYFSGSNHLDDIVKYSKFWSVIANKDKTLNSAYGHLLFVKENKYGKTQWNWAYESLVKDKDSRQAIMYFGGPDFQYDTNKDFVCTCFGQFLIRENKLHFHVTMRSNDLIKGTTFDIPFFTLLQQNMYLLLKEQYPELELGWYFHNATSLHIYENDFQTVDDMLNYSFNIDGLPIMTAPVINKDGDYFNECPEVERFIKTHA